MFKQKVSLVFKVTDMKMDNIVSNKDGREFVVMRTKGQLIPSKVFISVEKIIPKQNPHQFLIAKLDEFENAMASFDVDKARGKNTYASVYLKEGKDGVQYDTLKCDIAPNGAVYYKVNGFCNLVPLAPKKDPNEEDVLMMQYGKNTTPTPVSEIKPRIYIEMYALSYSDDGILTFTSGTDYPTLLVTHVPKAAIEAGTQPTIGALYKADLEFIKGKKIQTTTDKKDNVKQSFDEISIDFDKMEDTKSKSDSKNGNAQFEPDRLGIIGIQKTDEFMDGLETDTEDSLMSDLLGI